jgi:hypothetical protein
LPPGRLPPILPTSGRLTPVPGRVTPVPGRVTPVPGRVTPVPGRVTPVLGREILPPGVGRLTDGRLIDEPPPSDGALVLGREMFGRAAGTLPRLMFTLPRAAPTLARAAAAPPPPPPLAAAPPRLLRAALRFARRSAVASAASSNTPTEATIPQDICIRMERVLNFLAI